MTSRGDAAELLRAAGIGHGPGYHAYNDCPSCNRGGPIGPGAGYGGYAGCCGADYPQACCADVWEGYCDEPRCHFWSRLHARLTTDRACAPNPCCQGPEYGCNVLKRLFHTSSDCCVVEEAACEPSCEAEEAVECCQPCSKHKGIFGWLRRACGGKHCGCATCVDCMSETSESTEAPGLPPAPPVPAPLNDPA